MALLSLGSFDLESCVGGTPRDSFSTPTRTVLSVCWPKGPDDALAAGRGWMHAEAASRPSDVWCSQCLAKAPAFPCGLGVVLGSPAGDLTSAPSINHCSFAVSHSQRDAVPTSVAQGTPVLLPILGTESARWQ